MAARLDEVTSAGDGATSACTRAVCHRWSKEVTTVLRSSHRFLLLLGLIALGAGRAGASWDDWNCQLKAYWGALDGAPQDVGNYLGVKLGATDDWDLGIDAKKCPEPPGGAQLRTWFNRPSWNEGPIMGDHRAPINEATSKRWGTATIDTWNLKTNLDNGGSGVFDECFGYTEFPIAASAYINWRLGVGEEHIPPDDYTFTLIYAGGINPKPAGTKLPDAMDPPAIGTTWDMETTSYIVIPLWSINFQPLLPDCSDFAPPDTARFWILVTNPDTIPTCTILIDPTPPQRPPTTFILTAAAAGDEPFAVSWDFGDGAGDTGNPTSHTYESAGTYTLTCTVTDANGDAASCAALVEIAGPPKEPPTCEIGYDPISPTADDVVTFNAGAADADGTVVSVDWDFGDGGAASGDPSAHQYVMPGTYTVTVTVCDDHALCTTCTAEVTVSKGANIPPECEVTYAPAHPRVDWDITFSAKVYDPNPWGVIVSHDWNFGDGTTASGATVTHTYTEPGVYTVTCALTDDQGGLGTCEASVTVVPQPSGPIHVDCNSICALPDGSPECPYPRIQDAIDVAVDGETVMVLPGTYYERINFGGKAITVASMDPLSPSVVAATVIDGDHLGSVVTFTNGEAEDSVLSGFTITHGRSMSGGGIRCDTSSPTITRNVITENHVGGEGGGIALWDSAATIINSMIVGNSAGPGAAVYIGTMRLGHQPAIVNCTIADNTIGGWLGGIYCESGSAVAISNSIVWGGIAPPRYWRISITYSDTLEAWPGEGNISADPQFVDPENGDYHLLPTSPCIDAGTNLEAPLDDIDGDPRPWPSWGIVDMGADEWVSPQWWLPPTCWVTYDPSAPTTDDVVTFSAGAADPYGAVTSVDWDFGDGATATGDPATHQYAMPATYAVTATVCNGRGFCQSCGIEITVGSSCSCDVAIDTQHCKLPAAGHVGQCKSGQIGAKNDSLSAQCAVVMRVTDNAGNVVFESDPIMIGPGRRLRVRFEHCYTADEVGKNRWTWEVWPVHCAEQTPRDNVYRRKVNIHP